MKLSTSLVGVKKINSNVPRSEFSEDELNLTAELILKAEGIINPLVIRRTSRESYEVVNGHFEYYAAVKAREIDPRKGEMIGAFIIESENEEVLMDQIKVLRNRDFNNESQVADTQPLNTVESSNKVIQFESLLPEIESLIDRKLQLISSRISEHIDEFVQKIEPLLNQPEKVEQKEGDKTPIEKPDYDIMKLSQLKSIAKERNIEGRTKMTKKEQFITALNKADASRK
ncbi:MULTISPECIES: Rho termination factor N-terminal domain-containing protein [unclassified Coleofasciculus]|uniref:ParB N-terminal domain-containing protein n=1 Tax=Cyanophyceae TaxID=3028117 RepID=UPI00168916CD|nr:MULTISPECIES: Rho termination factor N-terminal domain-containing protein [unclassified Coleofasciculus]MBD1880199.1 Rho termination factor N-terminal domain-containing protein [Coleofasciculus sp. FACHB-T130]MBD2538468.1 Rho termination factor N-terminal domain-containing protein [Coleofasciculus sp. FACHB-SPT36]